MISASSRNVPSVRLHSGELSLSDWLHFSWFYPEGFQGEELLETERSWIVLGNGIAYKFLKSNDRPGTRATDRWLRSCRELLDNSALAGPVYLGLRCLNQEDGQLLWESRARNAEEKPNRMPKNVHDVALVMRRLHREDRLDRLLRSRDLSVKTFVSRVATSLGSFHEARVEEQRSEVLPTADQFLALSEERNLGALRSFLLRSGSSLDGLSSRGLEELLNHLSRYLSTALPQIQRRLRGGFVHDCHRNVGAETIFLLRDELDGDTRPALIARQPLDSGVRLDDCLFDVASLAIDLEVRGERNESEHFEEAYFATRPRSYDPEIYAFYKAAVCCRRLLSAFSGVEGDEEDLMEHSEKLFTLSMRLVHGLHRPAVILYQKQDKAGSGVDRKLAEILGAEHRSEDETIPEYLQGTLPDDFLFRRLLEQCRQDLIDGKVVVLAVRGLQWTTREELEELLSQVPCFRAIVSPNGVIGGETFDGESFSESSLNVGIDSFGRAARGPFVQSPAEVLRDTREETREKSGEAANNGECAQRKESHLRVLAVPFLNDCFPVQEQAFLTLRELRFETEKAA